MSATGPAGAAVSPAEFLSAIREIGLSAPAWAEDDGGGAPRLGDVNSIARRLIRAGALTEFQARYIIHGRASQLMFGPYTIADRIGSGTMGRIYRAEHRLLGRTVALKLIDPKLAREPKAVARFRREMRLVARLDHPNVIHAFDAGRRGDMLYIALEYADGRSLAEIVRDRGPMDPELAVRFAAQTAEALAHAHERGVIHRDVKPSNIILDRSGRAKLLDFGLGVLAEREEADGFATDASIVVGTAHFLSPEQACGRPIDGRSDLFSLGCTLYYLLTGEVPFRAETAIEALAARLLGHPTPIAKIRPGLPPRVIETLGRLLARRPGDRYRTSKEAAYSLRRLYSREAADETKSSGSERGRIASRARPNRSRSSASA